MSEEIESAEFERAAQTLANYVDQTGRPVRVFGIDSHARKIMHTSVNENKMLVNYSSGHGLFRHLVFGPESPEVAEDTPPTEQE